MSSFKTFTMGASALAFGLAVLAGPALADQQSLNGVADIDIWATPPGPEVVVRNTAGNHHVDNLNLAIQGNSIAVSVGGYVECTGIQFENWAQRFGHYLSFATYGIGRNSLMVSKSLPESTNIDHTGDMDAHNFQLPVAKLSHPQIDVDPVAVVLATAEQAPNKVQWLRQDHTLTVKIPLRWEVGCAYYSRNKVTKKTTKESPSPSYLTKDVDLKIKYEGDPQLFAVNAQIANSPAMQGGFKAADQPLKITQMTFQPNLPSHVGACPKKVPMRVNYTGQGKGDIRIRIGFGNTPKHESQVIAFDSKNGPQHYDFELETPYIQNNNLNNTIQYNLRVFVRGKDANAQAWPNTYQLMDSAVWKVRCTPQVNPVLGGGAVGGVKQGGGASPSPAVRPKRAVPVDPTPSRPARAD